MTANHKPEFRLDPSIAEDYSRLPSAASRGRDSQAWHAVKHVQGLLAERIKLARAHSFRPAEESVSQRLSFNHAIILEACDNSTQAPRLLYKPLGPVEAARTEFVSLLANLLGVPTPLALRTQVTVGGRYVGCGLSAIYVENTFCDPSFQFQKAAPAVINYIVRTRWFNELVGNLECWWGQFLSEKGSDGCRCAVMVDLDGAFCKISPPFLQQALRTHFHLNGVRLPDCRWLDREYRLAAPLGWAPDHYDSRSSFYGPLWRAYIRGEVTPDFDAILRELRAAGKTSGWALEWAMSGFLSASRFHHHGEWVWLPAAAAPRLESRVFQSQFVARCRRAINEFADFLQAMESARDHPRSAMHRFYKKLPDRPY